MSDHLIAAVMAGDLARVQELLESGESPGRPDGQGRLALNEASRSGHLELMRVLLASGAPVDLEAPGPPPSPPAEGLYQELMEGACPDTRSYFEGIRGLLDRLGEEVHEAARGVGERPLDAAVSQGHLEAARLLVEAGARVDRSSWDGPDLLACAAEQGRLELLGMLLDRGAPVHGGGWAAGPLQRAARAGHEGVVELLLAAGADPEVCDPEGITPLMEAARNGHLEVVRLLLAAGAVAARQAGGVSARQLAEVQGHAEVARLLAGHEDED